MSEYSLLLADDEESVLYGMQKYIITHTNCFKNVYCANNGQEALDVIIKDRPDIMIIDIEMPSKDGLQVLREANDMGIAPRTIILSGYGTFDYAQKALRLGVKDYLLKPVSARDILQKLNGLLGKLEEEAESETETEAEDGKPLIIQRTVKYIKENYAKDISLESAAKEAGITGGYLSAVFRQNMGVGFIDYLNRVRIEAACSYLRDNKMKVYEVAHYSGFHDEKYFARIFRKETGVTPSEYRKGIKI